MMADLTVWKWNVKLDALQDVEKLRMPRGARVVDVGAQANHEDPAALNALCIWALVDPKAKTETRLFRIAGTGHPLRGDLDYGTAYVGRADFLGGRLQLHVFDLGVRDDAD